MFWKRPQAKALEATYEVFNSAVPSTDFVWQWHNNATFPLYRFRLWEPTDCFVHTNLLHHHTGLDVSLHFLIVCIWASMDKLSQRLEHWYKHFIRTRLQCVSIGAQYSQPLLLSHIRCLHWSKWNISSAVWKWNTFSCRILGVSNTNDRIKLTTTSFVSLQFHPINYVTGGESWACPRELRISANCVGTWSFVYFLPGSCVTSVSWME